MFVSCSFSCYFIRVGGRQSLTINIIYIYILENLYLKYNDKNNFVIIYKSNYYKIKIINFLNLQ